MRLKKVSVLVIALLLLSGTALASSFNDTQTHWAKETIDWAVEKNIAKGYPNGSFKPNNHVAEAEFLAMLIRTYEGEKETNGEHWADGYYRFADSKNYPTNGSLDVNKRSWVMTRTQVAEIVVGTQGVNYTGNDGIHFLLLNGLAKGKDPDNLTIASYEGESTLTRAEALQFIKNVQENGVSDLKTRPITPSPDLPKIGVNDKIIPLKEVENVKPEQPKVPVQPVPVPPQTPINPNDNSAETVERRLQEALEMNKPELTLTQDDIYTWGREMFELGKKAEIVNGKLRLYYPQVPADKANRWQIMITVDNNGKRQSAEYGLPANGKSTYAHDGSKGVGQPAPAYEDFDIVGDDYSFYISLQERGTIGAKGFASTGYNSISKRISVNSRSVLFEHVK